jgi:hypothetical protein
MKTKKAKIALQSIETIKGEWTEAVLYGVARGNQRLIAPRR